MTTPATECPYIGLRHFEESDAALFYGRDEHVTDLLAKLSANHFVAVLGYSGSGKSSLVRAGLLPELRAGMIPQAGTRWKVVEFQPKNDPLGELAKSLKQTINVDDAREILSEGPLGLVNAVRAAQLAPETNVLVIADQFEEVFRFQREAPEQNKQADAAQCSALVRRLLEAVHGDLSIYILLVMRSDNLGECAQFPDLPERMSESLYFVPRLHRDELQEAITGPVGGAIEPALVQRLLSDMGNDQDQLPRLQHLLTRLWSCGPAHRLCIEDYDGLGGWQSGLSGHLNEIYNSFTSEQQKICRCIFQRLSDRDESNRAVRRRATVQELIEVCGSRDDAVRVIEAFRQHGFLQPRGALRDETLIDLTHECILRGWDNLVGTATDRGWLQLESETRDFYLELVHRASRSKRSALTGSDLETALLHFRSGMFSAPWARRYSPDSAFTETQNFVSASERRTLLSGTLALGFFTTLVPLIIVIMLLLRQGRSDTYARELTAYAAISQTADPATALFLGWQALDEPVKRREPLLDLPLLEQPHGRSLEEIFDVFDEALLNGASWTTLRGHQGTVEGVAWSPDGKSLASASEDKTVKLWDVAKGQELRILPGHRDRVWSVAWSPDGKSLASASEDKTVKLWDAASGKELRTLSGHKASVQSVAWSPDGKSLASASKDKAVKLWDVASGKELRTLSGHKASVQSVAWSPDGKSLASASEDKTIKLWDVASGQQLRTLGQPASVQSVAWNPDGKSLASASEDKTVELWDIASGHKLHTLRSHQDKVWSVTWSPDGKSLASASWDKTLKVWDAASGKELRTLRGHQGSIMSVAWSLDGKSLASASYDNTVKLWDAGTEGGFLTLRGHLNYVRSVSWSPDGKSLASGSEDKTVKLWDTITGEEMCTLSGHGAVVNSVAWSPDGKFLASASDDRTVRLWNATTGRELLTLGGHEGSVLSVTWSPDGKFLASASDDETVRLWDAATGQELRTLHGHQGRVGSVAWSPDGKSLASASDDKTVKLWNAATDQEILTLRGHQGRVWTVAWSPDGKFLASASDDKTVKLWRAATGEELSTLNGHQGPVWSVAWSPDSKFLASTGYDKTVKLWAATNPEIPTLRSLNASLTTTVPLGQEFRTFHPHQNYYVLSVSWSHDGKSLASASDDRTVRIYPVAPLVLLNLVRERIRQVTLSTEECWHYFGSATCPPDR